jgi:hypothetical protein
LVDTVISIFIDYLSYALMIIFYDNLLDSLKEVVDVEATHSNIEKWIKRTRKISLTKA